MERTRKVNSSYVPSVLLEEKQEAKFTPKWNYISLLSPHILYRASVSV